MMIRAHFMSCPCMPPDLKGKYKDLRANTSQGIDGSKQYWVDSAKKLGLVDTDDEHFVTLAMFRASVVYSQQDAKQLKLCCEEFLLLFPKIRRHKKDSRRPFAANGQQNRKNPH
eukprot:14496865-Ditylum_brightwellii.AAC.1